MSADTRPVPTNLAHWPRVKDLLPDQKLLLYILWSRPSSETGVLGVGKPGTLENTAIAAGLSLSVAAEAMREFHRRGLVFFDEETGEICVRDWLRFHTIKGRWAEIAQFEYGKIRSPKIKAVMAKEEGVKSIFPEKSTGSAPNPTQRNATQPPPTPTATVPNPGSNARGVVVEEVDGLMDMLAAQASSKKQPGAWLKKVVNRLKTEGIDPGTAADLRDWCAKRKKAVSSSETAAATPFACKPPTSALLAMLTPATRAGGKPPVPPVGGVAQ